MRTPSISPPLAETAVVTSHGTSCRDTACPPINDLKQAKGWSSVSLTAHKVKGDPFWKMVRPDGVPAEAQLKPDIVTSRFYTTCFTGVVVPYVCTTGSSVCGQ